MNEAFAYKRPGVQRGFAPWASSTMPRRSQLATHLHLWDCARNLRHPNIEALSDTQLREAIDIVMPHVCPHICMAIWRRDLESKVLQAKAEPLGPALMEFIEYNRPYALSAESGEEVDPLKPKLALAEAPADEKAEIYTTRTWTNQFFIKLLLEGASGADKLNVMQEQRAILFLRSDLAL